MTGPQRMLSLQVPRLKYRIVWWRRLLGLVGLGIVVVFLAAMVAGILGAIVAAISLLISHALSHG